MNIKSLEELQTLLESGSCAGMTDIELQELADQVEELSHKTYRDYEPHDKQMLFHKSPAKIRIMLGGNRSGKSFSGFHEDLWHLTGHYPKWYPENKKLIQPVYGRYVATDYAKGVGEVLLPMLKELVPGNEISRILRTNQGIPTKIFFKNGSTLDILTKEQDTMVFEGWHGHFVHFDEPPPRDKYIACMRGLVDYAGRAWFTLTPLTEAWIFDELYDSNDPDIFVVTVDMADNPHISREEIASFTNRLTDDEKEARLHGRFMHLTGLVYKEYERTVHFVEPFEIPFDWSRMLILDPHDRKPHALAWAAIDPYDSVYFYRDLEVAGTVTELSKIIKDTEGSEKINIRIIDPNKGRAPAKVGQAGTLVDEFRKNGLRFYAKVNDSLIDGHLAVKRYLKYDKSQPIGLTNRPKLYVFKNCRHIDHGFTHYVWDDYIHSEKKDLKEAPKDKYKDFPDLVRYCIMSNPRYRKYEDDDIQIIEGQGNSLTGF